MNLLGILSDFDPTLLPRQILTVYRHAWRREAKKDGIPGITVETLRCLARTNIYPFFIDATGAWSANDVGRLLNQYGIKIFGIYRFRDDLVFYVRIGQANFAQWLMERAGVPLKHRVLAKRVGKLRKRTRAGHGAVHPESEGWWAAVQDGLNALIEAIESTLRF